MRENEIRTKSKKVVTVKLQFFNTKLQNAFWFYLVQIYIFLHKVYKVENFIKYMSVYWQFYCFWFNFFFLSHKNKCKCKVHGK